MGFFASITLIITWTLNNQHTHTGRGTGMAILNIVGQMGPLIGTRLYPDDDAPYYVMGMAVCAGFMIGVAVLAMGLRWVLARRNSEMDIAGVGARYEEVELEDRGRTGEDEEGDGAQTGLMSGQGRREGRRYAGDKGPSYSYIL